MASYKALYICIIVLITICTVSATRRNTKLEYQEAFPNVDNIFLPVDMDAYAGNIYVTSLLGQVYKFANSDAVRQNQVYTFFDINLVTANGFKFFTNGFDGGDEGLTSIEFHPNFPTVPKFYAFYTATNTSIQIAAFTVGNAGVNYNSVDILLTIPKPLAHQIVQPYGILYEAYLGGDLRFHAEDSDDDDDDCHDNIQNLYISVGFGNKPGASQSSTSYLGKILRVTPRTSGSGYTIPNTNPRINNQASIIWARGLRNPRKINFADDPDNLFCAEVGDVYDEINVIAKSKNYGYEVVEGCSNSNLYTNPIYDYTSDDAHAITGGPYYPSGGSFKTIREKMLFADLYLGTLYALQSSNVGNPRCDKTPVVVATPPTGTQILISSILVVGNDVIVNNVIGAAYGLPSFYRLVEVEA